MNRGEIVERRVRESGKSIMSVARDIGKSTRTLYNYFERADLSDLIIAQIGRSINHNFDEDLGKKVASLVAEPGSDYGIDYKKKYFELLEDYNKLLQTVAAFKMDLGKELGSKLDALNETLKTAK
jgi:hypothetical protein